ncbi:MAG: OmpA family protein [Alphaproteobacteria bacterium]|nr:OmpA family protein [Alphaproteobacteria bacterium]
MKHSKFLVLTTIVAAGAALTSISSRAAEPMALTTHHLIAHEDYADLITQKQGLELHRYLNYEHREPCQNYREVPQGFYREDCDLKYRYPREPVPVASNLAVSDVITSYEIHFAFDSTAIDPLGAATVERIADEIEKYHPREVTVAGHTDKAGSNAYNEDLSKRRAQAISNALNDRGVPNRILTKEAFGEEAPAVNTKDGVPLRENRRVVVEFRK